MSSGISQFRGEYLAYLCNNLNRSQATITVKDVSIRKFDDFIEHKPIDSITIDDILLYVNYLSNLRGINGFYSSSSIYTRLSGIKCFFRWCEEYKGIGLFNWRLIHLPAQQRREVVFLDNDKYRKILRGISIYTFHGLRLRAAIEVLLSTGCRESELLHMKIEDVNFKTREVRIKAKGGRYDIVFLNDRAIKWLSKYLAKRDDNSKWLWITKNGTAHRLTEKAFWHQIKVLRENVNVYFTPHTFRHTFATTLLRNGANIREVQELMRHKSLESTMIYTHVTNQDLRKTHNKYMKV